MHTVINSTDFVCNVMKSAEIHDNAVPCYWAETTRISGRKPVCNIYRYAKVVCHTTSSGTIKIHMEIAVITVNSISNRLSAGSKFNQNVPNTSGILYR